MTLLDDALMKAFGQTRNTKKQPASQGPHFLNERRAQAEPRRELYLHSTAAGEPPVGETQSVAPAGMSPGVEPTQSEAAESPVAKIVDAVDSPAVLPESEPDTDSRREQDETNQATADSTPSAESVARGPVGRTKWTELFRHEVTTANPDLDRWLSGQDSTGGVATIRTAVPFSAADVYGVSEVRRSTDRQPSAASQDALHPNQPEPHVAAQEPTNSNRIRPDQGCDAVAEAGSAFEGKTTDASLESSDDEAASHDAESRVAGGAAGEAENAAFAPAWEVDRFVLPEVCLNIEQRLGDEIGKAAEAIVASHHPDRPVMMIGSWTRGEGRTTVTIVLARALAQAGYRVAVVDADEVNPSLARSLGVDTQVFDDPSDATENVSSSLADQCIRSHADRFTLLPLLATQAASDSGLSERVDAAITELKNAYDVILVDSPAGRSDLCESTVGLHIVVRNHWVDRIEQHRGIPVRLVDNFVASD